VQEESLNSRLNEQLRETWSLAHAWAMVSKTADSWLIAAYTDMVKIGSSLGTSGADSSPRPGSRIADDRMSSTRALLSSLNMLFWTSPGFGHTATDCISWMREAGFRDVSIEQLAGGNSMVLGRNRSRRSR